MVARVGAARSMSCRTSYARRSALLGKRSSSVCADVWRTMKNGRMSAECDGYCCSSSSLCGSLASGRRPRRNAVAPCPGLASAAFQFSIARSCSTSSSVGFSSASGSAWYRRRSSSLGTMLTGFASPSFCAHVLPRAIAAAVRSRPRFARFLRFRARVFRFSGRFWGFAVRFFSAHGAFFCHTLDVLFSLSAYIFLGFSGGKSQKA